MTLITLSILIILLLGFLSTMTIERRAAGAFEDTQRAKLVAQGAVSHAIDLLRTNIPEPARLSESPVTAPAGVAAMCTRSVVAMARRSCSTARFTLMKTA